MTKRAIGCRLRAQVNLGLVFSCFPKMWRENLIKKGVHLIFRRDVYSSFFATGGYTTMQFSRSDDNETALRVFPQFFVKMIKLRDLQGSGTLHYNKCCAAWKYQSAQNREFVVRLMVDSQKFRHFFECEEKHVAKIDNFSDIFWHKSARWLMQHLVPPMVSSISTQR